MELPYSKILILVSLCNCESDKNFTIPFSVKQIKQCKFGWNSIVVIHVSNSITPIIFACDFEIFQHIILPFWLALKWN